MNLRTQFLLLSLLCCGCDLLGGGRDAGFYLRFEAIPGTVFSGSGRAFMMGDRRFWTSDTGTTESTDAGDVQRPLSWATSIGDTAFGLDRVNGGVAKTTDWETFELVSVGVFDQLSSIGDTLVALRRRSFGRYAIISSRDEGATWQDHEEITAGFEFGDGEDVWLTHGADGRVRVTIHVYAFDAFSNTPGASQTFDFDGKTATLVGRTIDPDVVELPPPFPDHVSREGLGFFPDPPGVLLPSRARDVTPLTVIRDPGANVDVASGERLRWAVVNRDDTTQSSGLHAIGQDASGRLVVANNTTLYRTVNPLTAEDERASILAGPGCEGRSSWDGEWTDDNVNITVKNATGERLLMWRIDSEMGWSHLGFIEAGAETTTQSPTKTRLMFTRPQDDTCLMVFAVPDAENAEVSVKALTR